MASVHQLQNPFLCKRCLKEAGIKHDDLSLIELHSSNEVLPGAIGNEISVDTPDNKLQNVHTALGSASGVAGFSGAASGLVSIVKIAMSLRNDVLPPASLLLKNGQSLNERFHPYLRSFFLVQKCQ